LTVRGLLLAILVCGAGLGFLRREATSGQPLEVLLVALIIYSIGPTVARLRAPETIVYWDRFAITGLVYLATYLLLLVAPPPPSRAPSPEWIVSLAHLTLSPWCDENGHVLKGMALRAQAVVWTVLFFFSLLVAFVVATSAKLLSGRRRRGRAASDRILAGDAPHEPSKPYPS
jgi:hypothetical protein